MWHSETESGQREEMESIQRESSPGDNIKGIIDMQGARVTHGKNVLQEGVQSKGEGYGGQDKNDDGGNTEISRGGYNTRSGAAVGQCRRMIGRGRRARTRWTGATAGGQGHDGRSDGGQKHGGKYGVGRHGKPGRDKRSGAPSRHPLGELQRGEGNPNDTTKGADTGVVAHAGRLGRVGFGIQADRNGGVTR